MIFYLNEEVRQELKKLKPRKIQEGAIEKITWTLGKKGKLLVNMPCRTGKTFTTLYSAYHAGIELVIVLCGKASARRGYETDSAWINKETGEKEGFNKVFVQIDAVKRFLANPVIEAGDRVLVEVTPQLLNRNKDLVKKLAELTKNMKSVFIFDEAHFTEQTAKTKEMVKTITEDDLVDTESLQDFITIPWIYLTASPDTQSLQEVFSVDKDNYYEVTKEMEWELYKEDLKRPIDQREFDYVPVRNCLMVMNKLLDSVYNSANSTKQDYTALFTQNLAKTCAKKFILKTLTKAIEVINNGPDKAFMDEDETAPYKRRGSNINLMIKVPTNNLKTNKSGKTIAENIIELLNKVRDEILALYPEFTSIEIKDVTQQNNVSQDQANKFFDSNKNSINIILTQQRLIEGTTLYNLDAFLYYCTSGSLVKYKQESGRTLTPSANKRFGFIFFFDEDALANVKAILLNKINKLKGNKKHGPRKLTDEQAKRMTRINPAFIIDGNDDMKLVNYSQSLYTKSDLENTRIKRNLFDKEQLFAIPGLKNLIANLLTKMKNNTTTKKQNTNKSGSNDNNINGAAGGKKQKSLDPNTPVNEIEIEAFVNAIIFIYQCCIQNDVDTSTISTNLKNIAKLNSLEPQALDLLYNDEYTYSIMMEINEVLFNDQETINPEAF